MPIPPLRELRTAKRRKTARTTTNTQSKTTQTGKTMESEARENWEHLFSSSAHPRSEKPWRRMAARRAGRRVPRWTRQRAGHKAGSATARQGSSSPQSRPPRPGRLASSPSRLESRQSEHEWDRQEQNGCRATLMLYKRAGGAVQLASDTSRGTCARHLTTWSEAKGAVPLHFDQRGVLANGT